MTLDRLAAAANDQSLEVYGLCHTLAEDNLDDGTLALLGPREPGFWAHVQAAPEFQDGHADPMDRWSTRVITDLAQDLGGEPLFPFGVPARPFVRWALRSGRAWSSPVSLLVHDRAGLLVSYRGAILFPGYLPLPEPSTCPCDTCGDRPCLSACPVAALTAEGYNVTACRAFLDQPGDAACMTGGCQVRRACPVSRSYPRDPAQSAFHMAAFHGRD